LELPTAIVKAVCLENSEKKWGCENMAKMDYYANGRNDGLLLAQKIVKDGGIEALDKEIRFRNLHKINTSLSTKELDAASEKIKEMVLDTVLVMTVAILHDIFGFGQTRIQRFMDSFESKSMCLIEGYATWDDYVEALNKELNLELQIRRNP
jgi:hypothetical protein